MGGNNTCPFCRHKITIERLIVVSEEGAASALENQKDELLSKNENLDILINKFGQKIKRPAIRNWFDVGVYLT